MRESELRDSMSRRGNEESVSRGSDEKETSESKWRGSREVGANMGVK